MSRQVKEISLKSYVATLPFNTDFFTYTTTKSQSTFQTSGTLAANVAGATASTCPAGRILRENGRKLYPGAHPGVNTLMVGVFDNQSMLSGFIDPNSPKFAVYNTDRPNYLVDAVDPGPGSQTDQSAPVKTNGNIIVTGLSELNGGVKVGSSGTTILNVFKGTMTATNSLTGGLSLGQSVILTCPLFRPASVNDSLIVNQRGDIGGWLTTVSWLTIDASGNGVANLKCLAQGGTPGSVNNPAFNYTLIQS